MFRRLAPERDTLQEISRVEGLVRERFGIPETELILVSQDAGRAPGFPPLETNVVFWKGGKRYRLKLFAPASGIRDADLPVRWLLPSLEDNGESGCC